MIYRAGVVHYSLLKKRLWIQVFSCFVFVNCSLFMGSHHGFHITTALAQSENVPRLPLLQLKGYFRFRGDVFLNPSMGVSPRGANSQGRLNRTGYFPYPYPISAYEQNKSLTESRGFSGENNSYPKNLASANMRFRLETILNVSENLKIFSTLDFLDNLVLGSTPRGGHGFLVDPYVPMLAFSESQSPPSNRVNSFMDGLRVRHVYADVRTPFGILRLGRMPSHWGLGILSNGGMDLNADYGDNVDRVMFITSLFGHLLIPSVDIISSGPIAAAQNQIAFSQPFDPDFGDDARQFLLAIAKLTNGRELLDRKENGETIINYGLYFAVRQQELTSECLLSETSNRLGTPSTDPNGQTNSSYSPCNDSFSSLNSPYQRDRSPSNIRLSNRGALMFLPDIWFRLLLGDWLRVELEWTFVLGTIENGFNNATTNVFQWGGALEFESRLLDGRLWLGVDTGLASGDQQFFSRWSPPQNRTDKTYGNFRFDPGYQIDLILWREMYGAVNNAWYMKAHLTYNLIGNPWESEDGFGFRLAGIYSMALESEATLGKAQPLGVEFDASVQYASDDGYTLSIDYGILIPLPGLAYRVSANSSTNFLEPSLSQRIWIRMGIKF